MNTSLKPLLERIARMNLSSASVCEQANCGFRYTKHLTRLVQQHIRQKGSCKSSPEQSDRIQNTMMLAK